MMPAPWQLLDRRTLHSDRHLTLHRDRLQQPSGAILDPFWRMESPSWVCAVALRPDNGLVLVEQYRPGAGLVCTELPAGNIDPGESPAEAVVRELREETGYRALAAPEPLGVLHPEPNRASARASGFLVLVEQEPGERRPEAHEDLTVRVLPLATVLAPGHAGLVHGTQLAFLLLAARRLG